MNTRQFSIWLVDLNPVRGSEQKGIRPCLILQTNAVSEYGKTTMIAPLTSQRIDKIYPYEVLLEPSLDNGLKIKSKLKCDQIRVVAKERLIKEIGILEKKYEQAALEAMRVIFDMRGDFR